MINCEIIGIYSELSIVFWFWTTFFSSEHTAIAKRNDLTWLKQQPYIGQNSQVGERRERGLPCSRCGNGWWRGRPGYQNMQIHCYVAKACNELVLETLGIE